MLRKDKHLEKNIGEEVNVKLFKKDENGAKEYLGKLKEFNQNEITLETEEHEIKIERKNYYTELSESEKNHITETEIDTFDNFDYKVINSGYSSLEEQAKEIVKKENKK